MAGLIPRSLITEFQSILSELSRNWDDEGLAKSCQLIFEGGFVASSNVADDTIGKKPRVMMSYGGRAQAITATGNETTDNQSGNGSQGIKQVEVTKTIQARIYPVTKPFLLVSLGAGSNEHIWQMNTHKQYIPDILRAKEAIFDIDLAQRRVKVRLWKPPIPYGLGEAYQCKSFWIEV